MRTSILKKFIITNAAMLLAFILVFTFALIPAAAEEAETQEASETLTTGTETSEEAAEAAKGGLSEKSVKAIVSAAIVGLVAAVGAVSMMIAVSKSTDNMARQPEVSDKISSSTMLGLVFIETTIIYALIIAVLVIFVL